MNLASEYGNRTKDPSYMIDRKTGRMSTVLVPIPPPPPPTTLYRMVLGPCVLMVGSVYQHRYYKKRGWQAQAVSYIILILLNS